MAKISVAMCTYNGEKFLKEQLLSIKNQTFSDIDVVICDDCSTDQTVLIIEEFKNDLDITLISNEVQLGFVKNFEKVLYHCSGDYIALCDQDDIWEETKLSQLMDALQDNYLVYSDALLVDATGKSLDKNLLSDEVNKKRILINKDFVFSNYVSGNTALIKKELLTFALPFPDGIYYHDMWLAFVASSVASLSYVDKTLVCYRQHGQNITDIIKKRKTKKCLTDKIDKTLNDYSRDIHYLKAISQATFLSRHDKVFFENLLKSYKTIKHGMVDFSLFAIFIKNKKHFFSGQKISTFKTFRLLLNKWIHMRLHRLLSYIKGTA